MPIKYDEFIRRTAGTGLTQEQSDTFNQFSDGLSVLSNNAANAQNWVISNINKLGFEKATAMRDDVFNFSETFNTLAMDLVSVGSKPRKAVDDDFKNSWNESVEKTVAFFNKMLEGNNFNMLMWIGNDQQDQAFGQNMENYFAFIELMNRCFDAEIDIDAHKKKYNEYLLAKQAGKNAEPGKKEENKAQPEQKQEEQKQPENIQNDDKVIDINAIDEPRMSEQAQNVVPEENKADSVQKEMAAFEKLKTAIDAHTSGKLFGRGSDQYDRSGEAADKVMIHLRAMYKLENKNFAPQVIHKTDVTAYEEYLQKLLTVKAHLEEMHETNERYYNHKKTDKRAGQWAENPDEITNKNARKRVKAVMGLDEAATGFEDIIEKKIKVTEKVIKENKDIMERNRALMDHNTIAQDNIRKLVGTKPSDNDKFDHEYIAKLVESNDPKSKQICEQIRDNIADIIASTIVTRDDKKNLRDRGVLEEVEKKTEEIKNSKALKNLMDKALAKPKNFEKLMFMATANNTIEIAKAYNKEKTHIEAIEKQQAADKTTEIKPAGKVMG